MDFINSCSVCMLELRQACLGRMSPQQPCPPKSGPLGRQAKVRNSPPDSLLSRPSGDPIPASESRHRLLKRPHVASSACTELSSSGAGSMVCSACENPSSCTFLKIISYYLFGCTRPQLWHMGSFDVSASCVYVFMYVNEIIFFLSRPHIAYTAYRAVSFWVDVKGLSVPVCACAHVTSHVD